MRDFDAIKKKEMSSIENRIRHIYNVGYEDCLKDQQQVKDEAYKQGLHDAWACCKRFLNSGDKVCDKIFGVSDWADFLDQSPSEAIEKFKEYDKKTFDIPDNCKIEVGDEVRDDMFDKVGVVIRIADNHAYVLKKDGIGTWTLDAVVKTGNHFEEVSDMMKHLENTNA